MATESKITSESLVSDPEKQKQDGDGTLLSSDGLHRRVKQAGHRFEFAQLLRILEAAFPEYPDVGHGLNYAERPVQVQPSADLVFPPSDIKEVIEEDARVRVIATFYGLYGIDSPLPYHFYEPLARRTRDTEPNRELLDIFNHRFYAFFYRAWKKWRPYLHFRPGESDRHSQRFFLLTGLDKKEIVSEKASTPMRAAGLAGIFGKRHHSAEDLETLLGAFLGDLGVEVIENVPRWVPNPSRAHLGEVDCRLGDSVTIGKEIFDRSSKFRIRFGPLSLEQYRAFLPGGEGAEIVRHLVQLYVPPHLDYDVELQLPSAELPTTRLGTCWSRLGHTTSLGEPVDPTLSRIVVYQ